MAYSISGKTHKPLDMTRDNKIGSKSKKAKKAVEPIVEVLEEAPMEDTMEAVEVAENGSEGELEVSE